MAMKGSASLSVLLQKTTLDDHAEVLKLCNAALKKSKGDTEAQQVKAVALLKLDRYDEALHHFEESGEELKEKAPLEYAYTLYKTGKLEKAATIARSVGESRGAKHVEAQATYRAEKFSRTLELYKELLEEQIAAEEYDLRVNRGALQAQLEWTSADTVQSKRPFREDLEQFETSYNAACASIARGELTQAEVLLKRAKTLCQHSDDLTDEIRADELLPICVQQLHVLQRLGKTTEAEAIAAEIAVGKVPDASTRNIAQSNLLAASDKPSNPFLAHKLINSTPPIPDSDKLFSYQLRTLHANKRTVDLQSFKFDGVARSTAKRIAKFPHPATSTAACAISVLNAAAHAKGEVGRAALTKILPELEKRPNDVGLILTIIQLYITTNDTTSAINLLESFFTRLDNEVGESSSTRHSPGLISIMLALYKTQNRQSDIARELAKAATHWRQQPHPSTPLLQAAGRTLLTSSSPDDTQIAAEIFGDLHAADPNSKSTLAGYIASHASLPISQLTPALNKLTPLPTLLSHIDVSALEGAGIPQSSNALAIAQAGSKKRKATDSASASNKRKRIRKSRLPKGYDPAKPVKADPERWLPLRDRSSYRPKGKKKGRRGGGGDERTQGGVVAEDMGVNGTAPAVKQSAGTVVTAPGGGGGKGKKKKGRK
jgi:signal recognition particle subunit SRP72